MRGWFFGHTLPVARAVRPRSLSAARRPRRRGRHRPMELSGVSHGEVLPSAVTERVPHREKIVLAFVLAFLEARSIPAQLLVNGGYVRDLLLGKTPDDLDLSLCLRDCAPDVTIDSVMGGLSHFAAAHSEHCVTAVKVSTILSDASKDKNVDTAKALVTVGGGVGRPERVEVDFMPTIGEETYDESDRVPLRDVRGTPEQDALRRDLTIGAMLLHVTQPSPPEARGRRLRPSAARRTIGALRPIRR